MGPGVEQPRAGISPPKELWGWSIGCWVGDEVLALGSSQLERDARIVQGVRAAPIPSRAGDANAAYATRPCAAGRDFGNQRDRQALNGNGSSR